MEVLRVFSPEFVVEAYPREEAVVLLDVTVGTMGREPIKEVINVHIFRTLGRA